MDQRNEGGKKSRAVEGHGPVFLGSVAGYWVWLMADEVWIDGGLIWRSGQRNKGNGWEGGDGFIVTRRTRRRWEMEGPD